MSIKYKVLYLDVTNIKPGQTIKIEVGTTSSGLGSSIGFSAGIDFSQEYAVNMKNITGGLQISQFLLQSPFIQITTVAGVGTSPCSFSILLQIVGKSISNFYMLQTSDSGITINAQIDGGTYLPITNIPTQINW